MTKTLGGFILAEMDKRKMSAREFANHLGVAHTIINKFLNHGLTNTYADRPVGNPSLDFLEKLAKGTGADICYLIELTLPDAPRAATPPLSALQLSRRIEKLPENVQEAIDVIIMKFLTE